MKEIIRLAAMSCILVLLTVVIYQGQSGDETIPKLIEKDGRHALLVDGTPANPQW